MKTRSPEFAMVATLAILWSIRGVIGIKFVIDREECFSHNVEYDGDTIHLSFVVIKSEGSWHYAPDGVDLVWNPPFTFTNKSPYHETVDFDVHEAHFSYHDQHAKDEHLNPLLQQISISLLIFSI
ncbi:Transmembrane emp24 domain-containing protein p24beta2 [Camellia lanceoleosa]|nr:Transmembrane emp24 domain-containing protein p24beta2 [Camellia lanceoleosa]